MEEATPAASAAAQSSAFVLICFCSLCCRVWWHYDRTMGVSQYFFYIFFERLALGVALAKTGPKA